MFARFHVLIRYLPLSHFVRGHLSGFLSGLLNAKVRAVERRCIAAGDPYCEFYLEEV